MRAMIVDDFGGPEKMKLVDIDAPQPQEGEVQIGVRYAAVNPVDWKIREGWLKKRLPHLFPLIPGWDVAGVVAKVGKGVEGIREGDEVFAYCRKPIVQFGTYAEFVCVAAEYVAKKPTNLTFGQAAAIPLTALTAWQALYDAGRLKKGETVLIHAGAGGVGSIAIQLAKQTGTRVLTTASAGNHRYVQDLGADLAIDYNKEDFVAIVKNLGGADLVLDCVGSNVYEQSGLCMKDGGALVTICRLYDEVHRESCSFRKEFVFVRPDGKQLKMIGELFQNGKLVPPHIQEFPLEKAAEAMELNRDGHTQGKIVLKVIG